MFLVVLLRSGPEYDHSNLLEDQPRFAEHAAFMDSLVDDGFVVLAGPLADEPRGVYAVDAESAAAVRTRIEADPGTNRICTSSRSSRGRSDSMGRSVSRG